MIRYFFYKYLTNRMLVIFSLKAKVNFEFITFRFLGTAHQNDDKHTVLRSIKNSPSPRPRPKKAKNKIAVGNDDHNSQYFVHGSIYLDRP